MEETEHHKGCCVELGHWPINVQLGSTNSKGLHVLFQGSHQGFLLNNQSIRYDRRRGHAHGCPPTKCIDTSTLVQGKPLCVHHSDINVPSPHQQQ